MKLSRMICYPFCMVRRYKVKEVKRYFIRAIHPESLMDKGFTEKVNKVNPDKPNILWNKQITVINAINNLLAFEFILID